jgi:hypothetical protein
VSRLRRTAAAALVAGLALAACSSGGGADAARREALGDDDAAVLSQVLSRNYDGKGATFAASLLVRPGTTLTLQGEVDWVGHRGRADVRWDGNDAPGRPLEVAWANDAVVERLAGLPAALAQAGRPAAVWVGRPADTANGILDRAVQFVAKLSATQRDNPVLLQQDGKGAWLRAEKLDGATVDVYRYGDGTTFWVRADDRALVRVEGALAGFAGPLVVRLLAAGEQRVLGPKAADVAVVDDVQDLYDRLNPPPR